VRERERLRQLAEAQDAAAQLQKDVAELNKLAEEVPKLNKMMSDAGRAYFNVGN
jgi:flagellar hook-associated protein FlgK